jgi:hypothetical protein
MHTHLKSCLQADSLRASLSLALFIRFGTFINEMGGELETSHNVDAVAVAAAAAAASRSGKRGEKRDLITNFLKKEELELLSLSLCSPCVYS